VLRPRPAAALLVATGTLLVGACTGSSAAGVDLDGLAETPCAPLVGSLDDVDADLRGLADDDVTPEQVAKRFATVQDALAEADAGAELDPAVTELITRLGFYRVAVDTNNDDTAEAEQVRTALGALAEQCRAT
jgi:hypothetical protein